MERRETRKKRNIAEVISLSRLTSSLNFITNKNSQHNELFKDVANTENEKMTEYQTNFLHALFVSLLIGVSPLDSRRRCYLRRLLYRAVCMRGSSCCCSCCCYDVMLDARQLIT